MRTVIKELWVFSIAIVWKQWNTELHGTDGLWWLAVYQATISNLSRMDSVVLQHSHINEILKWTKEHLDAYLASADVIIDQRDDEPG
jgi:hypothetical protein